MEKEDIDDFELVSVEENVDIDESDLVTIVTTCDEAEAEFLGAHLDGEGFVVFIAEDEDEAVTDDVVEIKVPSKDAKAALAAIEPLRGMARYFVEDEEGNIDTGWGGCTKCKSRDLMPITEELTWREVLTAFLPGKTGRILTCNQCGFRFVQNKT